MDTDPDINVSTESYDVLTTQRFAAEPFRSALLDIPAAFDSAEDLARSNDQALKSIPLRIGGNALTAAVKHFASRGPFSRYRDELAGTRAERCQLAARHLQKHQVGTPTPIAAIRGRSSHDEWWVTEVLPDHISFKDQLIHLFSATCHSEELMALLQQVADAVRSMHSCGLFHGDLGNQNILLSQQDQQVYFIDLNRARIYPTLSLTQRARDLSRIHLPSDLRRIFYEMIYENRAPRSFLKQEAACRRRYRLHSRSRKWRHPLRERRRKKEQSAETAYPDFRDIWIWDDKSMQAISSMRSRERHRYMPFRTSLQVLTSTLKAAPAVWPRYKKICREVFQQPVQMHHRTGLSVEPTPERWPKESALLEQLPVIPILIRFYHHQDEKALAFRADCVKALHAKGYSVSAALIQDRRAVTHPESWHRFCHTVLERTEGKLDWLELGHAVNRVKWGCWSGSDIAGLSAVTPSLKEAYPAINICGPAGIDFEYHRVLSALGASSEKVQFDALSHHLYVDRRGAPENPQAGFSTWQKCALLKAIADTQARTDGKLLISEVNWPLQHTGIYSPVGSPYLFPGQRVDHPAVSEKQYASYMIRYLLQTLCSGLVERVYWWNLAAHGFGLVDDQTDPWRPRPAFTALQTWMKWMQGATFTGFMEAEHEHTFTFSKAEQRAFSVSYDPHDPGTHEPVYHQEVRI